MNSEAFEKRLDDLVASEEAKGRSDDLCGRARVAMRALAATEGNARTKAALNELAETADDATIAFLAGHLKFIFFPYRNSEHARKG